MSAADPIPLHTEKQTFYAPSFELYVKGNKVPLSAVRDVMEVTYEDGRTGIIRADVRLCDVGAAAR